MWTQNIVKNTDSNNPPTPLSTHENGYIIFRYMQIS